MISTATALIDAVNDSIFDEESMDFAKILVNTHNEMTSEEFAKAIYLYSGIVASTAMDKATKVLLNESQLKELLATIGEMETLRNEVLNG